MPGEPELNYRCDRETHGIDVDPETMDQLLAIGQDFGCESVALRQLLEEVS